MHQFQERRSLGYVGGAIKTVGDSEAKDLAHALDVAPEEDDESSRAHLHGFHTYPARLHPTTAHRLIQAFSAPGERVFDPFCGSGTTLIEALTLGRSALGVDLNPLAVRLSRCKLRSRTAQELNELLIQGQACAAYADQQRKAKAGASRRFSEEDVQLFEPHVLLELGSLQSSIQKVHPFSVREDLTLVLSAILVKLSRKRGDTSKQIGVRRTAPGFASRIFLQKTEDFIQRFQAFQQLLKDPKTPTTIIEEDDATELKKVTKQVDAIITSPPYVATYNYMAHHELRLRWLGLDATEFSRRELGSRSRYQRMNSQGAYREWSRELAQFFQAAKRVLRPKGHLVLIIADSAVGSVALRADEIVAETARAAGFIPVACASQERNHFHGPSLTAFLEKPRSEHAILLRRV